MLQKDCKEEKLKINLKRILAQEDLTLYRELIARLSDELGVSPLDCAAALSFNNHPNLFFKPKTQEKLRGHQTKADLKAVLTHPKFVRYRLEIGRKHQVSAEEIKNVLVEVSGVDRNRIGRLEIHNHYVLVDLPDGMPADIFQLLAETEIKQQKINIKRIKYQRKYHYRRKNKKRQAKS